MRPGPRGWRTGPHALPSAPPAPMLRGCGLSPARQRWKLAPSQGAAQGPEEERPEELLGAGKGPGLRAGPERGARRAAHPRAGAATCSFTVSGRRRRVLPGPQPSWSEAGEDQRPGSRPVPLRLLRLQLAEWPLPWPPAGRLWEAFPSASPSPAEPAMEGATTGRHPRPLWLRRGPVFTHGSLSPLNGGRLMSLLCPWSPGTRP